EKKSRGSATPTRHHHKASHFHQISGKSRWSVLSAETSMCGYRKQHAAFCAGSRRTLHASDGHSGRLMAATSHSRQIQTARTTCTGNPATVMELRNCC